MSEVALEGADGAELGMPIRRAPGKELPGPVDGDEQIELTLHRLTLGDVDVNKADR